MKAIILVAGYATRLYPLTENKPKALLPINKKPIISYIVDKIHEIKEIDEIYVVTNHKFADHFTNWAEYMQSKIPISILDDGTKTEETRLGAIGDILFTIHQKNIQDDLMIIAGDNFFTYSLKDYYDFYQLRADNCVCVKEFEDREQLKQMGVAQVDENKKIIGLEEKPQNPKSNLAVYATYFYPKKTLPLFERYIEEGNKPDAPGYFVEWLYKRENVYAYPFTGECYDIGTPKSYQEVCQKYEG